MRTVSIVAAGMTPFGAFAQRSIGDLAEQAGRECLESGAVDLGRIEALYVGNFAGPSFVGQNHLAPLIASRLGLAGVPATRFEAACASSGAAFFHAWAAVAGGVYDAVMVLGVEQMSTQPTETVGDILASAGDVDREASVGATFPGLFAMIAKRHMLEHGTTREHLAAVAVKNHAAGLLNPGAHLRKAVTVEQALSARVVADPLTLYDCSLISDGAAAVVLAAESEARSFTDQPVRVRGLAQASDRMALEQKPDITTFSAVKAAGSKACRAAGIEPADVDFAELHDCFTIAELIALEDLGFFERGAAGPASAEGRTARDGDLPVNVSGGLKSKGHPVGATGVAQVCEVFFHLRGEAGERQLPGVEVGLTENLGGSGATAVVGVYST